MTATSPTLWWQHPRCEPSNCYLHTSVASLANGHSTIEHGPPFSTDDNGSNDTAWNGIEHNSEATDTDGFGTKCDNQCLQLSGKFALNEIYDVLNEFLYIVLCSSFHFLHRVKLGHKNRGNSLALCCH